MISSVWRIKIMLIAADVLQAAYSFYFTLRFIFRGKDKEVAEKKLATELGLVAFAEARKERWIAALFLAKESIGVYPQQVLSYITLGLAYLRLGDRSRAIAAYERVAHSISSEAWMLDYLAFLAMELERYPEAEEACHRALEIHHDKDPLQASLHLMLGIAVREQQRMEEGLDHLKQAHRIEPQNVDVLTELGITYIRQDRIGEATSFLIEASHIDPTNITAHSRLGEALSHQGRWKEALEEAHAALKLCPDDPALQANARLCEKALSGEANLANDEDE